MPERFKVVLYHAKRYTSAVLYFYFTYLEACPVNKSIMNALEFVVNGVIRKIFSIRNRLLVVF